MQTLLARDAIVVDGMPVGKSHRLVAGTVIELLDEPAVGAPPVGDASVAVDVKYADDDVIVVAKPAGLVVHSGAGHPDGTLVNGLLARFPEIATVGDEFRPGHRASTRPRHERAARRRAFRRAYDSLVHQISTRTVERRYVALAWGALSSPRGVIDAPIGRSTARRTRMAVRESGKAARTEYEVRRAFDTPVCALLDCRLETGPHPSDPCAPERDRPSDRRRRDLRRLARGDPARSPVPPRRAARVRSAVDRRAPLVRRPVAGRPRRRCSTKLEARELS